jgi:cyclophilin family peptidyl-prolyl cis-trans isomerase
MKTVHFVWLLVFVVGYGVTLCAQETKPQTDTGAASELAPAEQFQKLLSDWKALLKEMRDLRSRYTTAPADQEAVMKEQWAALVKKGNDMLPELHAAALRAYEAAPDQDSQVTRFLVSLAEDYLQRDLYDEVLAIGRVMKQNPPGDRKIFALAGRAAFCLNEFDEAESMLSMAKEANALDPQGEEFLGSIAEQKNLWAEELKFRQAEDAARQANDPGRAPEVKLQTTQGDIVLLLFEDQAPETVGNFISLVEQGFYNGLTFHRVLPGFMAQGGCPKGDGTGGPGYTIYDEFDKPNARKHFRGSLSMAKTAEPNSGGSQFFITFRPTPHLNGKHTVFGRVIEGWDVLAKIRRRNPEDPNPPEPDKILKAEVLVKRNHEYAPHKVSQ